MNDDHFGNREEMIARYRALQAETGATIATLRADLASVRLDYANECDRARRAEARHERDKDELRADLARVTGEREEATVALEGVSNALGGLELYALSETAGHVETAVADRDEALADLARVTVERDEARAKVAGLTAAMPSGDVINCIAMWSDVAEVRRRGNSASAIVDAWLTRYADARLTRYAEALGGGR